MTLTLPTLPRRAPAGTAPAGIGYCPHGLLVLEERDGRWVEVCCWCGDVPEPDYCTAPSGFEWTEVPDWGRCYWGCLDCGEPEYTHRKPRPTPAPRPVLVPVAAGDEPW